MSHLLVLVTCLCGQISGPAEVDPGVLVRVSAIVPEKSDVLFDIVDPEGLDFEEVSVGNERKLFFSSGLTPGNIRITAITITVVDGVPKLRRDKITIKVKGETPPNPPPGPTPPPVPVSGLKVMILEETDDRHKLSANQISALTSTKVITLLDQKCDKAQSADGKTTSPCWRILDDDFTQEEVKLLPGGLSDIYSRAVIDHRETPWVYAVTPKGVVSRPYPKTVDEAVSFFQGL